MGIKIDFQRAFDSVNLNFIYLLLNHWASHKKFIITSRLVCIILRLISRSMAGTLTQSQLLVVSGRDAPYLPNFLSFSLTSSPKLFLNSNNYVFLTMSLLATTPCIFPMHFMLMAASSYVKLPIFSGITLLFFLIVFIRGIDLPSTSPNLLFSLVSVLLTV